MESCPLGEGGVLELLGGSSMQICRKGRKEDPGNRRQSASPLCLVAFYDGITSRVGAGGGVDVVCKAFGASGCQQGFWCYLPWHPDNRAEKAWSISLWGKAA